MPEPIVREVRKDGRVVALDLSSQAIEVDVPEPRKEFGSEPVLDAAFTLPGGNDFVPLPALFVKAKRFDDALFAGVELALQRGAGKFEGKARLIRRVAARLAAMPVTHGASVWLAAANLGLGDEIPAPHAAAAHRVLADFEKNALRSKPISFYAASEELRRIFRQDRMMQTPIEEAEDLARVVLGDPENRESYDSYLRLIAGLTNRLGAPDLRRAEMRNQPLAIFPPSRSPETDLLERLLNGAPMPDGFSLIDEVLERVRAGSLSLAPQPDSGWYEHQLFSLEPLVGPRPEAERARAIFTADYRKFLEEVFRTAYATTRETHAKQLEIGVTGAAFRVREFEIEPELSADPLPLCYLRRALAYDFVRGVLVQIFGERTLAEIRPFPTTEHDEQTLDSGIAHMKALFHGAYVTVSRQMGLVPADLTGAGSGRGREADAATFRDYVAGAGSDPSLTGDLRMMVPVAFDVPRKMPKVWCLLGWEERRINAWYKTAPKIVEDSASGRRGADHVAFTSWSRRTAVPVMVETFASRLYDRDEFRRLCDREKTRSNILRALLE